MWGNNLACAGASTAEHFRQDRDPIEVGGYYDRPGLSPVTAGLVASGLIRPGMLLLEIGVGDGLEAVELAEHGIPVVGIDTHVQQEAIDLVKNRGLDASVLLFRGKAQGLRELFDPGQFDIVLDVLVHNNVALSRDGRCHLRTRARAYARGVASVLRPGGFWIVQGRITTDPTHQEDFECALPSDVGRWFHVGPAVATHLPEYVSARRRQGFTPIGVQVLIRR